MFLFWVGLVIAAGPLEVGGRKQLFLDDRFIAEQQGVVLRVNPAQKLGPLLDEKGERLRGHIARVIDHQGKVKLYLGHEDVQVLESEDGLKFRRTGVKLPGGQFPTPFLDAHEKDPAKRYKLFHLELRDPFDPARDGVFASYSADGIHFTKVGRVFPFFTDNPTIAHWDDRIGKYVVYTRAFDYDSENQRRIGRLEMDDVLKLWPYQKTAKHRIFPSLENIPVVYAADGKDDPHSDVYYNAAEKYAGAQDAYLMFPSHFRHFSPQRQPFVRPRVGGQWEDFGMLEAQLAVSRDGVKWTRPERIAYIANGLVDEWDRWYTVAAPGMARRGNYHYQYYYSSGRLHDSAALRPEYDKLAKQEGGVGVTRQRLDGFVSVDADAGGGWLRTPVLVFAGKLLRLNIDTGAMGNARVEVQDAEGKAIPGFGLADCEEIGGNFIDQVVHWKGGTDVSKLAGKPVRLKVEMKRGKLYAFQFGE